MNETMNKITQTQAKTTTSDTTFLLCVERGGKLS